LAMRRGTNLRAAGWLGLAIAVKGYALFVLPAFAVFVWRKDGFRRAVLAVAIAVAPFLVQGAVVLSFAGWDGLMMPFQFHANRKVDSESSLYDALAAVGWPEAKTIVDTPRLATVLEVASALLAAGLMAITRRRDLAEAMAEAGLIAIVGLISFSLFVSP